MATDEFRAAIDALLASAKVTAYMCAEAVPWRCHRNLVSDELVRRGIQVLHILGPASFQPHALNSMAVERRGRLVYPARRPVEDTGQELLRFGGYNQTLSKGTPEKGK
jgi:uncharacterized protein (DUF488 family)